MSQNIRYETYSDDKIEDQVELVNCIAKSWTAFGYPDAKSLRSAYDSNSTFTPETRHYYYDEEKLIGFVSSAVESPRDGRQYGSIQFPFVVERYKHLEEQMMNKAIDVLKSKGVEVIVTNFHHSWGDSERIINEYNYQEKNIWDRFAILENETIDYLDLNGDVSRVTEFDVDLDGEKLFDAYFLPNQLTRERYQRFVDSFKNSATRISFPIIIRENKLKAFTRVEFEKDVDSLFTFSVNCFDQDEEQRQQDRRDILQYIFNIALNHPSTLYLYLGPDDQNAKHYERLGIQLETIKSYEMNIS